MEMVQGKWAWITEESDEEIWLVFENDGLCSFHDTDGEIDDVDFCMYEFDEKNMQVRLWVPSDYAGDFMKEGDLHYEENWLEKSDVTVGPYPFHEMVLGRWTWSSDGAANAEVNLMP